MSTSNSPKYRDFFITINQGASCYNELENILRNDCNYKLFAMIKHDKDINREFDQNGILHEVSKKEHYHIMLELKNPISLSSIKSKFEGAHIEIPRYKKSAYQYLLHNSPNSKEKYQYAFENIISNNPDEIKQIIESETYELFFENMFVRYLAQGVRTPYQFAKRFGLNAYKQYWSAYSEMIRQITIDEELRHDIEEMQTILDNELPF